MPRWEHGSEDRLKQAATELFEERGFQNTTAVEIAKRARVTTRTFFRYFADKQAVVFADAERLRAALIQQLGTTADAGQPLRSVTAVLAGFDWESLGSRESQRRRDRMIASNPELLERDLMKQHEMAEAFSGVLRERGVEPYAAELAARVGIDVFRTAYRRWLAADEGDADLSALVEAVMTALNSIAPAPRGSET